MPLTRARLLRAGLGVLAAGAAPRRPRAEAGQDAVAFVRQVGNEFTAVMSGALTPAEKRRRLGPFLDRVVDFEGAARFCLGRFWRLATPQQQAEFVRAFHAVLVNNVISRVGEYQGGAARVTIGRPEQRPDGIYVPTVVEREGSRPANVTWVVGTETGQMRLVDVQAEGISLRLTLRSDYAAFLGRNNNDIAALIRQLEQQVAQS